MSTQVISLVGGAAGAPIVNERLSGEADILPGMLVVESAGTVIKNATADALAPKLFALKNIANAGDIDTPYDNGVTVSYGAYCSGQRVGGVIAAGAAAIADGAPLASAGDGTLKIGTAATAIGWATEAVDNSSGATPARISVRVA